MVVVQIWPMGIVCLPQNQFHDAMLGCGLFKFSMLGSSWTFSRSMSFSLGNIGFHLALIISLPAFYVSAFCEIPLVVKPPGLTIFSSLLLSFCYTF